MNEWRWIAALVAGGALVAACATETPDNDTDDTVQPSTATTSASAGSSEETGAVESTGAGDGGICDSGLSTGDDALDGCLTQSCCDQFDVCFADAACLACLTGAGSQCDSNALFQDFNTCAESNCPTDMCGSGIGFTNGVSPMFDCNACGDSNCCMSLDACADPSMDGYMGPGDPEVSACVECLNDTGLKDGDPATGPSGLDANGNANQCPFQAAEVQTEAENFNLCISTSCALACDPPAVGAPDQFIESDNWTRRARTGCPASERDAGIRYVDDLSARRVDVVTGHARGR